MHYRRVPRDKLHLLTFANSVLARLLQLAYKLFVEPLDRLQSARADLAFERQVRGLYGNLLQLHGGAVVMPGAGIRAFDYVSAELVFPDIRLQITCGRKEVSVLANGLEVFSSFGEDYEAALQQSAIRLAAHWNQLPLATMNEAQLWAQQDR